MAFDPIQEDCLRLALRTLQREQLPLDDGAAIENIMERYRTQPSSLIATDADRSFHLVARATELLDYRAPFMTDETEIDAAQQSAENYLREAIDLDESNWDAQRMLAGLQAASNDEYLRFLLDRRNLVEQSIEEAARSADDIYEREYAKDLAHRPYLRWLAATASRAVISGRYRMALDVAEASLAYAPDDPGDIRHTGMLALAKLEAAPDDLRLYRKKHGAYRTAGAARTSRDANGNDAWTLLAHLSSAYRTFDFDGATRCLRTLLDTYPGAAESLYFQAEFPDGLFARVNVLSGSQDELILAISESVPLLQEGLGAPDNACFASWIATHELVQAELDSKTADIRAMAGNGRTGDR